MKKLLKAISCLLHFTLLKTLTSDLFSSLLLPFPSLSVPHFCINARRKIDQHKASKRFVERRGMNEANTL